MPKNMHRAQHCIRTICIWQRLTHRNTQKHTDTQRQTETETDRDRQRRTETDRSIIINIINIINISIINDADVDRHRDTETGKLRELQGT